MAGTRRQESTGRDSLTPQSIAESAIALADAAGLGGLTIRRLARVLGVTPMALYWHFRDKDELLDAMAGRILGQVDLSVDAAASWQDQLRVLLGSMVEVLRAHPSVAMLISTRTASSHGSLQATEVMLDILRRGGFLPAEATQVARHAVITVTNLVGGEPGVVVRDEPASQADARARARSHLESLPVDRFPRLVEAAGALSEGVDPDTHVAFGLNLLLAGIDAVAKRRA